MALPYNQQNENISENQENPEKQYNYDAIKKLAKKINQITTKKNLIDIIKIIKTLNSDLSITENSNGMFIKFNKLTQQTYIKLDNYIHKNILNKSFDDSESITSEYIPYSVDDTCSISEKYKLSNKEKNLIKKQNYSNIPVI